ncbi:hypothetical protein DEO72_LG7g2045 [Vigna unguiculata]|uniref:Uncharacterized protein n=1 Tax=Vigna unguiculata TaxID=3917 RepID=A0A4D6MLW5_VIGUN|nr:hypothetical protein DEO72_LG7g2045 [Vigna unguiculata]
MKHENCLYLNHFVVDDANFLSFDWSIEESNKEIAMDGDGKDFVVLKELAIELKIDDAVLAKLGVMATLQGHDQYVG